VIVVAGHDQHFAISAQRIAQLSQHRLGAGEDPAQRPVAHLEHVAQQDQSVDPSERVQQCRSLGSVAQHVDAAEPAEVQV
jgi:hypothetical protein